LIDNLENVSENSNTYYSNIFKQMKLCEINLKGELGKRC